MMFKGDFSPVLSKHSKNFNLVDALSIGVDRIQRGFEPLQRSISTGEPTSFPRTMPRLIIYEAFVEGKTCGPPRLINASTSISSTLKYEEFKEATLWTLSNAFTSAFKDLKAFQQFRQPEARLHFSTATTGRSRRDMEEYEFFPDELRSNTQALQPRT